MDDRKPDKLELQVRAVCGGLLGLFVSACVIIKAQPMDFLGSCAIVAVCVVISAFCAVRFGDEFWLGLKWWI
jgi:hypothetical protein